MCMSAGCCLKEHCSVGSIEGELTVGLEIVVRAEDREEKFEI